MSVRDIVLYAENPAPLRRRSKPVKGVNRHTQKLIQDLKDTLNAHAEGVGLAAPQINVHFRVVLVRLNAGNDAGDELHPPIALVNPQIIEASDERLDFDGCLSFPGIYADTVRPHHLRVTGLDEDGKPFDRLFTGFDAVVVHHEIDHLNGVLFIDRVEKFEDLYRVREDEHGRFQRVPLTEPGLNYLCTSYKAFFNHVDHPMKIMANLLHQRRAPAEIMTLIAVEDEKRLLQAFIKAGRNDPCPCGSGKKFKQCHGRNR